MSDDQGRFVWYELMTTDTKAAKAFYTELINWGTQEMEGDMEYTMFTSSKQPVAGLMTLPDEAAKMGAPPHWLAYIWTDDVDATVKQAKSLGGEVLVPPRDIPNMGRFSVLRDPQGAVIAVWHGEQDPQPAADPKPGNVSWHELATTDLDAAWKFYGALFGWSKTDSMDMGEMGTYQMFGPGGRTVGGIFNKSEEMPFPPNWCCYISVDDIGSAVKRAQASGGKLVNGPMEVPGGDMIAQFLDPQGAYFALHAPAAAK